MKTYKIGVVGGDGIGPEVATEAVKVLKKIQDGFQLEFIDYPFGADHYLKSSEFIPDKAIAVRAHDLLRRVFDAVAKDYPDIQKDNAYVDATCMWFVKNPEAFDVLVTTNMFGDIITDLGAMIQGGMGIAAGGNIHPGKVSVFEPIHGSAPKYKGLKKVSPLAAILAGGMLLEQVGDKKA